MADEAILQLRDVAVDFSGFRAINGLDLRVARGELRCLILHRGV